MMFSDLDNHTQNQICFVCTKALLASFSIYLDAGKFTRESDIEKDRLWREYQIVRAKEKELCNSRIDFSLLGMTKQETKEERHVRFRLAREIDEAKRAYLISSLGLEKQKNREGDWAKIGQRLAQKYDFSEALKREPGRPTAQNDINIVRAMAFDSMKFFVRVAQGKETIPAETKLEYPITEIVPKKIRLSDSLILSSYRAIFEINFTEEIEFMLGIVEEHLRLLGAKSEASLLNSVSRGRTLVRSDEPKPLLVKNHNQIFNKK